MPRKWQGVVRARLTSSCSLESFSARRISRSFALAVLAVCGLLCVAATARAGAPDPVAGAKTFKANCVLCHGDDGHGSATGKALKVADLTSDAVQKLPTEEMVKIVSNGKNNMPPWKASLTPDQIASVVAYVRKEFGKKK